MYRIRKERKRSCLVFMSCKRSNTRYDAYSIHHYQKRILVLVTAVALDDDDKTSAAAQCVWTVDQHSASKVRVWQDCGLIVQAGSSTEGKEGETVILQQRTEGRYSVTSCLGTRCQVCFPRSFDLLIVFVPSQPEQTASRGHPARQVMSCKKRPALEYSATLRALYILISRWPHETLLKLADGRKCIRTCIQERKKSNSPISSPDSEIEAGQLVTRHSDHENIFENPNRSRDRSSSLRVKSNEVYLNTVHAASVIITAQIVTLDK
ncbi:hypothetical protein E2C01_052009 [Portunus trituberculatus]|uniref:Uncharacterized protein n=1 Tax=Portunus trituberculatus TaxID=210409 RepID=A0A5B7GL76_PORTR|nr:hypothetical protein [Portunus trituberculatus]